MSINYDIIEYSIQMKKIKKIFSGQSHIDNSYDAVKVISKFYDLDDREKLYVILLDSRKRVIGINLVSVGTIDYVIIHPREVFKPAILLGASAIIIVHNHPSQDPRPSEDDIDVTEQIIKAGNILQIPLIDHIIYCEGEYYSIYGDEEKVHEYGKTDL
ncbi:MAG: JAB domain-containing protein [Lachnospiraceae bacterium]|nr:JAB domain-containing protein [Lachnospiraceae bacterium]